MPAMAIPKVGMAASGRLRLHNAFLSEAEFDRGPKDLRRMHFVLSIHSTLKERCVMKNYQKHCRLL
jgi:hypothetical protein